MSAKRDPIVIETIQKMQEVVLRAKEAGQTVGCVPTMGYLHDGHASLIREAAQHHPFVVVSIFVNPTQFGPTEDFARYPRDLERDLAIAREAGATHVFVPSVEEMYPGGPQSSIHIDGVTEVLEGVIRPTHFDGVATVVSRLFEAMQPSVAYFGQKDLQQTLVIKRLVEKSPIPCVHAVNVRVLPTIREQDGLARSSRNVYLTEQDRADAPIIYAALCHGADALQRGERDLSSVELAMKNTLTTVTRLELDYAVAVDADTLRPPENVREGMTIALLIAARLGSTRLIDNMLVSLGQP